MGDERRSGRRPRRILVLGGGIAGLSAAARLQHQGLEVTVLEAEAELGGLARSFVHDRVLYEFGPHFMLRSLAQECGVLEGAAYVTNVEAVYHRGAFLTFPFGLLRDPVVALSVAGAYLRNLRTRRQATSLADHLRQTFGTGFASSVGEPLIAKWAGAAPTRLAVEMASRLDPPQLAVLAHHLWIVLTRRSSQLGQDGGDFWVHPEGGSQAACDSVARHHQLRVERETRVERLLHDGELVAGVVAGGREWLADGVLSTLPRALLDGREPATAGTAGAARVADGRRGRSGRQAAPPAAASGWRTRAAVFVGLVVARDRVARYSWTWFPAPRWTFYRVYEPKNTRDDWMPAGQTLLLAEIGCDLGDATWRLSDEQLGALVWPQLMESYGLRPGELVGQHVLRVPYAYAVLQEQDRALWGGEPHRGGAPNLFHAGRFGGHRHWLMHEAYASGQAAAEHLQRWLVG